MLAAHVARSWNDNCDCWVMVSALKGLEYFSYRVTGVAPWEY